MPREVWWVLERPRSKADLLLLWLCRLLLLYVVRFVRLSTVGPVGVCWSLSGVRPVSVWM